ncbi:MAG TPA: hypothetical protein VH475_06475 [Tepidisphaeraceae bacterium]
MQVEQGRQYHNQQRQYGSTRSRSPVLEPLEPRLQLTAANFLVANGNIGSRKNFVYEYNQSGQIVRTLQFPNGDSGIRDVVVDPLGRIQAFDGTFSPTLATYNAGTYTSHTYSGWSIYNVGDFGGIAAIRDFVFVTDEAAGGDAQGIVRFDTANNYAGQRFATDLDTADLSIGMDGLLYVMAGNSSSTTGQVVVFNPSTMERVRTITPPGLDNRAVTADAAGNIYVGSYNGFIYKLSPSGTLLKTINTGADDLDISTDNVLLARTGTKASLYDTNLNLIKAIPINLSDLGSAFVGWATPQVPPGPNVISAEYLYAAPKPTLRLKFTRDVSPSLDVSDLRLRDARTGVDLPLTGVTLHYDPAAFTADFVFNAGPPPDGNYHGTVLASPGLTDRNGNPMAADFSFDFYVLAGDANRDRTVDFADLTTLAQNYNTTGKNFAQGDFDYDGDADFADLVILAQRYDTTLMPPVAAPVPVATPVKARSAEATFSVTSVAKPRAGSAKPKPAAPKRR